MKVKIVALIAMIANLQIYCNAVDSFKLTRLFKLHSREGQLLLQEYPALAQAFYDTVTWIQDPSSYNSEIVPAFIAQGFKDLPHKLNPNTKIFNNTRLAHIKAIRTEEKENDITYTYLTVIECAPTVEAYENLDENIFSFMKSVFPVNASRKDQIKQFVALHRSTAKKILAVFYSIGYEYNTMLYVNKHLQKIPIYG